MDERILQFRVGVVVLFALLATGILVLAFNELPTDWQIFGARKKIIFIAFAQAPGVSRDTPVRKSGILIGRVTNVEFVDPPEGGSAADAGGVLVTAAINRDVILRENEVCRIGGSLLGDAVLEFVPSGNPKLSDAELPDGATIIGISGTDPLQLVSNLESTMSQALTSVAGTSDEIGKLARRFTDLLDNNDEQISRVATKAEDTLDRIRAVADNTNEVLGDPKVKEDLKRTLADFPDVMKDTREAIDGFKKTLATADRNLQNIEGLTKPLGERGEQLVDNIDRTTAKLDGVLEELSIFSKALNDPNGSLGQLINNPELYEHIDSAIANIDDLTRELKPVIRNARAFSDKIARHPELLGVRGALHPSSGIK